MALTSLPAPSSRRSWIDRLPAWLVAALLVVVCLLIGCHEMSESDVWWHLRAGQYILSQHGPPRQDPFTFSSADRRWIDLHWGFEVVLAGVYGLAGVAGLVLLSATAYAAAVLLVWLALRSQGPAWLRALGWLPALLVLSWRYMPRPEAFSALLLCADLAVLTALDRRPRLAWILVLVQLVWVNVHALFILGPIVLSFYLAGRALRWPGERWQGRGGLTAQQRRWWWHVGLASAASVLVCLANPYLLQGVLFPLELFAKVDQAGGLYKDYIGEFRTARGYVDYWTAALALGFPSFRAFMLLLVLLPASFLVPAAWRAWQSAPVPRMPASKKTASLDPASAPAARWATGAAGFFALLLLDALSLPAIDTPRWLVQAGQFIPLLVVLGGAVLAVRWRRRSTQAALLAATGSLALGAWMVCLPVTLLGTASDVFPAVDRQTLAELASGIAVIGLLGAGVALVLVLRHGGSLFGLLLCGAFAYLGLQAVRNVNFFALVSATVLSWNMGEWASEIAATPSPHPRRFHLGIAADGAVAVLLGLLIVAIVTDRYDDWMGLDQRFGLREKPFVYAHEAARFSGQEGLPDRAVVFSIAQSGVYIFHNGPQRKLYMDARLEVPRQETFENFIRVEKWLRKGDPLWDDALHRMGDPLVLVDHHEPWIAASLLAHPRWRCVHFDPVAWVFLARDSRERESLYPTINLASWHFHASSRPELGGSGSAAVAAKALQDLAVGLLGRPQGWQRARAPLLLGLDYAGRALQENPADAGSWVVLGNCHLLAQRDPTAVPPPLSEGWDPVADLPWAMASHGFRQATERAPTDFRAWQALFVSFQPRRLLDAQRWALERLAQCRPHTSEQVEFLRKQIPLLQRLQQLPAIDPSPLPSNSGDVPQRIRDLLAAQRPLAAVDLARHAEERYRMRWSWPLAERLAGAYLQLGRPAEARRIWEAQIGAAPHESLRQCRIADTFLVERNWEEAIHRYRSAVAAESGRVEAWYGLALLYELAGQAGDARDACEHGLRQNPSPPQRTALEAIGQEVRGY